jgi:hypothetical protein
MRKSIASLTAIILLGLAGAGHARNPVEDGKLQVKPTKDGKYIIENNTLGKAEFFGYVGDFVDTKKITGIVLRDGEHASDEQKHIVAITAKTQKIDAFIELGGKQQVLVDPTPSASSAPPPVNDTVPVPPQGH